jgi:hypothetical protein
VAPASYIDAIQAGVRRIQQGRLELAAPAHSTAPRAPAALMIAARNRPFG